MVHLFLTLCLPGYFMGVHLSLVMTHYARPAIEESNWLRGKAPELSHDPSLALFKVTYGVSYPDLGLLSLQSMAELTPGSKYTGAFALDSTHLLTFQVDSEALSWLRVDHSPPLEPASNVGFLLYELGYRSSHWPPPHYWLYALHLRFCLCLGTP